MRAILFTFALACGSLAIAQPADPTGARIVGEWRGTSLCTNLKLAPACNDENVRYLFSALAPGQGTYHLVAQRMASGSYQTMYEIDLAYSAHDATWRYEWSSGACARCTWWYRTEGAGLVGGITHDSGEQLRKVSVQRPAP